MKRLLPVLMMLSAVLVSAAAFGQESLPDVFNRMKSEFNERSYQKSLADVELLDSLTRKPGFESDRAKLEGPISFYRAANLAALGRRDDALEEFGNFLLLTPNADITSPPYPKAVVDAFHQAQKAAAGRSNSIQTAYASFAPREGWYLPADSQWIKTPVRYLLTSEQKKAYADLMSDQARKEFVETFWKEYDPAPDTPANEFRQEFERRIAFAQMNFTTSQILGVESDRAVIFAFLGPPTYASLSNMSANDDAMALLRGGRANPRVAPPKNTGNSARGFDELTGNTGATSLDTPDKRGTREAWHYRAGRIPEHVPFKELRFEFLSKEGYGDGVLQKDPAILQALGIATETAKKERKLN